MVRQWSQRKGWWDPGQERFTFEPRDPWTLNPEPPVSWSLKHRLLSIQFTSSLSLYCFLAYSKRRTFYSHDVRCRLVKVGWLVLIESLYSSNLVMFLDILKQIGKVSACGVDASLVYLFYFFFFFPSLCQSPAEIAPNDDDDVTVFLPPAS